MRFYRLVKKHYVLINVIGTIITLIAFGLVINAEVKNAKLNKENAQSEIDTYAFVGMILLFIGFIASNVTNTYISYMEAKKL